MLVYLPRTDNRTIEDNTIEDNIIKNIEAIKDRIIRDIKALAKSKKMKLLKTSKGWYFP